MTNAIREWIRDLIDEHVDGEDPLTEAEIRTIVRDEPTERTSSRGTSAEPLSRSCVTTAYDHLQSSRSRC